MPQFVTKLLMIREIKKKGIKKFREEIGVVIIWKGLCKLSTM
jgi:hypothetical protein